MGIDIKTVERLATLAKLEFSETEKLEFVGDMNRMLDFVKELEKVDTEGVEPLIYLLEEETTLREDEVKQSVTQQQALQNAPESDSDFIKVPKVLNQ